MDLTYLTPLRERLNNHPVYGVLDSIEDLRVFMNHHVFSVWDFMSLAKYLQGRIAPTSIPWTPHGNPSIRRFINEIMLEEESDIGMPDSNGQETYASHFELYCQAMGEIGASIDLPMAFLEAVHNQGIHPALEGGLAPEPSRQFMAATFGFISSHKPHVVAAAFALGREHVIPQMFRAFLSKMHIGKERAPAFK